ncbi:guanine deaminase [Methylocaldum szegediense]|uniref:Guanine deaminase n=1 Tax=Methylocaldum szegediense TaxID=73780 RepID=A0ABN8X5Z8_9GAMM|nr:guanine deaminase [Methylocaldum szegediense]CAI8898093.1 putative guanine deaminase [Methylocaldum szegediense]
MNEVIHTGTIAHLRADPFTEENALEIIECGALAIDSSGRIASLGERTTVFATFPESEIVDHGNAWLIPGLIDAHLHFPQFYATAGFGTGLLDWLEHTVYRAEARFADESFAKTAAEQFVERLLACGTTTAMVFGSQFYEANAALFEAAGRSGMHLIAGITLMDRNAPAVLLTTVNQSADAAEKLIALCRQAPRLHYAITPRFALSCSPELLELCGSLLKQHPDSYVQTHINETRQEVAAVRAAFPKNRHYLDVYDSFGLLTERTVLAHSIYTTEAELARMAAASCAVCHCPTSNAYLGSGLFPLRRHLAHGIRMALGTDIGAGTQFSVWRELSEAFKVQQLQGFCLNAAQLLYLATLAGAKALGLEREVGNFAPGKSADFFVLDYEEDRYIAARLSRCESAAEQLFCLLHLADERHVDSTYVQGRLAASRNSKSLSIGH